ncbi:MAG: hypothetical protein QM308_10675 [Bacillota bacterium]|nr:hypothetical protein [Bacillota bacterium]
MKHRSSAAVRSLLLAALLLFLPAPTLTETALYTPADLSYEALPIPSMFTMTAQQAEKLVRPSSLQMLELELNNDRILLPVDVDEWHIYTPEETAGYEIFSNSIELSELMAEYPWIQEGVYMFWVIREASSEAVVGELDNFEQFYPNEAFFSSLLKPGTSFEREKPTVYDDEQPGPCPYRFERADGIGSMEIREAKLHDISKFFQKAGSAIQVLKSVFSGSRDSKVPLKEVHQQYMNAVSCYDWPVTLHWAPAVNQTLPRLTEEALSREKKDLDIVYYFTEDTHKFIIVQRFWEGEDYQYVDFFTREQVENKERNALNPAYAQRFGLAEAYQSSSLWWVNIHGMPNHFVLSKNSPSRAYDENAYRFVNAKTVADVIEAYQYLPLELQMDYSTADFSNNPDIEGIDKLR